VAYRWQTAFRVSSRRIAFVQSSLSSRFTTPRLTPAGAGRGTARLVAAAVLCLAFWIGGASDAAAEARPPLVASLEDAFISHASGSDAWSIGSERLELVVGFDRTRTLGLQRLFDPSSGREWPIAPGADVSLTAAGEGLALGAGGALAFVGATAVADERSVTLAFTFEHRAQRLLITRVYAAYPVSPTIETWTRVTSTGGEGTEVSNLVGWQMTMPLGPVRWLSGLRGDSAGGEDTGAFELGLRELAPGEEILLGGEGRSSERFVPFFLVGGDESEFYGGLMWSGAWRTTLRRVDEQLRVSVFFPGVGTTVTAARPLELPHTFFGVTAHAAGDAAAALNQFIVRGIRRGRPLQPLVTYNTWFTYGTWITEEDMVAEMDRAAALGVEMFVIDAGWYVGAGDADQFDFDSGLGTWEEDTARFPSGVASLADYARGLGMKFGLWVEPERVALAWVDKPGLARESWLVTRGGDHGSPRTAQICLVKPEARQWVLERLVALIERVHPDYLKWDNNFWINCDRAGHGHGPADGNLSQVKALYSLLQELRQRFPDLLIENVSGGGARLDFGILAYTDTAWMDDRTSPASHVRHNLEGLTLAFPPGYLLSFLIDGEGEPIAGAQDLALLTRSRAPGIFGLTYKGDLLDTDTSALLQQQIAEYKSYRAILSRSTATLLTAQAPVDDTSWDVLQEMADDLRSGLIFGFKGNDEDGRLLIRLRGLIPDATYDVESVDAGSIGAARGEALMRDGIELVHAGGSRAHVLVLKARD
jgi:alpha-galactosidase